MYDSGCLNAVEKGSELEVELTERGDELMYSFNGKEMVSKGDGEERKGSMVNLIEGTYGKRNSNVSSNVVSCRCLWICSIHRNHR